MNQTRRYLCCLFALGVASLLLPFRLLQVTGPSMEPTLRPGERYLLDRFYYRLGGIQIGDIVVVDHEGDQLVKRVKGRGADLLRASRDYDGYPVAVRNLTAEQGLKRPPRPDQDEMVVPPSHLYLLGDNVYLSDDSRQLGPIPADEVIGVVRHFTLSRTFPEPRAAPSFTERLGTAR